MTNPAATEQAATLGFSLMPGIGPVRFSRLVNAFGSAAESWRQNKNELISRGGLSPTIAHAFDTFRRSYSYQATSRMLEDKGIDVVYRDAVDYPALLKEISDPPIVLYVKGDRSVLATDSKLAVVGTRRISTYGKLATEHILSGLPSSMCIVSGLALGIDGVAHRMALQKNIPTVAVLGCGVDIIAPPSHRELYEQIVKKGLVISEMPPGFRPTKGLFPARNRIISGLSQVTLVIEAPRHSGALITARCATEQGREVATVPGSIFSEHTQGPHYLLQQGASLVTTTEDVVNLFGSISFVRTEVDLNVLSEQERWVIKYLSEEPRTVEMLVQQSPYAPAETIGLLTKMELSGYITSSLSDTYTLTRANVHGRIS